MQLELDVRDRKVVVLGSYADARRVLKRYHLAGARVRAVLTGPLPAAGDRLPGVRYAVRPDDDSLSDWVNLLAPCWLVVLVGVDPATERQVDRLCRELRIGVAAEPAAVGHGGVTLVGGGPGATDLLTLQACAALREADVVFYDRLAPSEDLGRLAPAAELVDVGKSPHHHPVPQAEIQAQLVARAREGAAVVRLKGGDSFVFGRGGEEVLACVEAGVAVRVVPGISSAVSVPAAVGIPVTHRGISRAFTVISGHDPLTADELTSLARLDATLVILMGINNLPQICAGLLRAGQRPSTPAAVVERGFSTTQRTTVTTLDRLAAEVLRVDVRPPAVVVIGDVVGVGAPTGAEAPWWGLEPLAATGPSTP